MAPSGRGSSVSSESEGSNFFHAHDGDREEVRILALRRVYGVAEKAQRLYGCEGRMWCYNWLETSEKKLRRSRGKVAKHYAYSFVYVRGLKDYVPR